MTMMLSITALLYACARH